MESEEFELMAASEDHMWWFRGLHGWMLDRIEQLGSPAEALVLDCGAGTGGFAKKVGEQFPTLRLVAVDFNSQAIHHFRKKTAAPVVQGSVNALPFASESFSAIVSSDLLYHSAVDEQAALSELRRTLRPGGHLLLNLPAYSWMKSTHDQRVHTVRRYTARGTLHKLRTAGFYVDEISYRNSLLFPLMALWRLTLARFADESDVADFPPWQEFVFGRIINFENSLARKGVRFPFGGSVYAHAIKASTG